MSVVSAAWTALDVAASSALAPRWGEGRAEDWLRNKVLPDFIEFPEQRVVGRHDIALHHARLTIGYEDYLTAEFSFIGAPQLHRRELKSLVTENLPGGSVLEDGLNAGWAIRQDDWIPEGISAYGTVTGLEKAIREFRGQVWVQKARYRLLYPRFVDFPAEDHEYPLVEDRFVPALGVQGFAPGLAGVRGHSPRR